MVKEVRNSAWSNEHRHTITHNQGIRVIDFKTLAVVQLHSENLKGPMQLQDSECVIEIINRHCKLPRMPFITSPR